MEENKETKTKSKKLIIIIAIVALLVIAGVILFIILGKNNSNGNTNTESPNTNEEMPTREEVLKAEEDPEYYEKMKEYETNTDCTKKGNVCNIFDIGNGLALNVKVSDAEEYAFHVIANDENTMTLLSDEAILTSAWSEYKENFFGPELLLNNVFKKVEGWNKVNYQELKYSDTGYKMYKASCYGSSDSSNELCRSNGNGIGYESLNMSKTGVKMKNSYGEEIVFATKEVYARPATYEEISALFAYGNKITWLENTEPFWTMSSLSDSQFKHNGGYVVKSSDSTDIGITTTGDVITTSYGVRLVVTINKEA